MAPTTRREIQQARAMINYILLVSRQGTQNSPRALLSPEVIVEPCKPPSFYREGSPVEMVHHHLAQSQGKDCQGRDATRPRPKNADV